MPRTLPKIAAPTWSPPDAGEQSFTISVVTPMFGGGYQAREVDMECPIRAAAVRGHLRFWWRATAGAQCKTAEELFTKETKLWGSDKEQGQIAVQITNVQNDEPQPCGWYERDKKYDKYRSLPSFQLPSGTWLPAYALQPFQGKVSKDGQTIEEQPSDCIPTASFKLTLTAEKKALLDEARSAVLAWVKFGGIGARTRRGCGSLRLDVLVQDTDIIYTSAHADDLTVLKDAQYVLGTKMASAIDAWREAVDLYWRFRQQPGYARNLPASDSKTPGRSWWPEPDSVRLITGEHYQDTEKSHAPIHKVFKGFPRADLGLPIIFHFKDRKDRRPPYGVTYDPAEATLEGPGGGKRRFASPVITKAVQVEKDLYCPLLMVLNAPHAWHYGDLKLTHSGMSSPDDIAKINVKLTTAEQNLVPPMKGNDVREALLRYAEKEWSTKRSTL